MRHLQGREKGRKGVRNEGEKEGLRERKSIIYHTCREEAERKSSGFFAVRDEAVGKSSIFSFPTLLLKFAWH